jgi:hypothetical protein
MSKRSSSTNDEEHSTRTARPRLPHDDLLYAAQASDWGRIIVEQRSDMLALGLQRLGWVLDASALRLCVRCAVERPTVELLQCAEILLRHGVDPNVLHYTLRTCLAPRFAYEFCKLLLTHGARADHVDAEGNTPLHLVVMRIYDTQLCLELIRLLIAQHGAHVVNAQNADGDAALHIVARQSAHPHICAFLVHPCGGNVNLQNVGGNTPLHEAVLRIQEPEPCLHMCRALGHPDPNVANQLGHTPLYLALRAMKNARSCDFTVCAHLLSLGGDPNEPLYRALFTDSRCVLH